VDGRDPARDRDQLREAETVAQLCDLYMEAAKARLVLGREGTPKKASTLATDGSRIDAHIKPHLGHLKAGEVTRADIEGFKAGVVTGKTARDKKLGPRSRSIVKGGKGALTRTLGLLGRFSPGASIAAISITILFAACAASLTIKRRRS
jgi:hypothetical protein